jgi:hypothetical protein
MRCVPVPHCLLQKERNPRERLIGREFARVVKRLNHELPAPARMQFVAIDYGALVKSEHGGRVLLSSLRDAGMWTAANTGFFCNAFLPRSLVAHRLHAREALELRRKRQQQARSGHCDAGSENSSIVDARLSGRCVLPRQWLSPFSVHPSDNAACVYLGVCPIERAPPLYAASSRAVPYFGRWRAMTSVAGPAPARVDEAGRTQQLLARWAPHLRAATWGAVGIASGAATAAANLAAAAESAAASSIATAANPSAIAESEASGATEGRQPSEFYVVSTAAQLPSYFSGLCQAGHASSVQVWLFFVFACDSAKLNHTFRTFFSPTNSLVVTSTCRFRANR